MEVKEIIVRAIMFTLIAQVIRAALLLGIMSAAYVGLLANEFLVYILQYI